MSNRPSIEPGVFISVGTTECVVFRIREIDHPFGDCEVVYDCDKPANRDVVWRNDAWAFANPEDLGGYAERNRDLWPFIRILRRDV